MSDPFAAELGIRYLIEGRVQTSAERARIGVALIDGVEEKTPWDEYQTYQGSDLLEIEDDIISFVSRELDSKLFQVERERVPNLPSENMSAREYHVAPMTRSMGIWIAIRFLARDRR